MIHHTLWGDADGGTRTLIRESNVSQRKVVYSIRLGIEDLNNIDISEIGLQKSV